LLARNSGPARIVAHTDLQPVLRSFNAAAANANQRISDAAAKLDILMASYNRHNADCSWRRPGECIAAAADWVAAKTGQAVLNAARAVADKVLRWVAGLSAAGPI
jgi:hypothetical protein